MRVAIHKNDEIFKHSTLWTQPWIQYCEKNNIEFEVVNCFDSSMLEQLKDFDCLLWHFSNYALQDMLFARTILNSANQMGIKVFPDFNTSWHFDDKIAEYYLLQSIGSPIPESWVFYTKQDCLNWLDNQNNYPFVAKLKCGSGSQNVKLLKKKSSAVSYVNKMFRNGFRNTPSILFKATSNIKSSKNLATYIKRFKRIPDFYNTWRAAKKAPRENGYVYFQEFIPNDGYDIKIIVIGDKLTFINRTVRKGDFRASGGGAFNYNKDLVSEDIIKSAFEVNDKLGFQCMGYDYVVDSRTKTGKIIEISYGFSHIALMGAGGYWDRDSVWHDEPLNAPEEVLSNLVKVSN